jgi:DNA polymerase III subunit delta'
MNSRLTGHEDVKLFFQNSWDRNRFGQGYLFVGPSGVGKAMFANELARSILCENSGGKLIACDKCTSCILVGARTHPDLFHLNREVDSTVINIDQIRDLISQLALKPVRGKRKIAIIDDADDLDAPGANAFLKSLEEPPPNSIIFLVGGPAAESQLATIRSRCQIVRFKPLSSNQMEKVLESEGVTDPKLRQRILRIAPGSPGKALQLQDPSIWEFRTQLLRDFASAPIDSVSIAKQWLEFAEQAGKESIQQRRRILQMFDQILDVMRQAVKIEMQDEEIQTEERQALLKVRSVWSEERLLETLDRAISAQSNLERRLSIGVGVEAFCDSMVKK